MADTAARLVDGVLPDVPVRQWVLSLPFELRYLCAARADVLSAVARAFIGEVFRWQLAQARALGIADAKCGAVTFVQRFGGSLSLNVHFHVVALEGVHASDVRGGPPLFHPGRAPGKTELTEIAARVCKRVTRLLKRKGLADALRDEDGAAEPDALQSCRRVGAQRGLFGTLDARGVLEPADDDEGRFGRRVRPTRAGQHEGFDVHADVCVAAGDRDGRERLCRYCARPPFSLERLSRLPDGRIAYKMKHPGPHGHTHRLMTPIEFMARLAALVPPPRFPLVRYHGTLAPHSRTRSLVVPRAPVARDAGACAGTPVDAMCGASAAARVERAVQNRVPADQLAPKRLVAVPGDVRASAPMAILPKAAATGARGGTRLDWATLLERVHGIDALACPRCDAGRLEFIAVITDRHVARKLLDHVGEASEPAARRRHWDPFPIEFDVAPPYD